MGISPVTPTPLLSLIVFFTPHRSSEGEIRHKSSMEKIMM
jgi:hypothetical protein